MRTVGFNIKIPLTKESLESKKQLETMHKGLDDLDKKTLPKLTKTTKEYLKGTRDGFKEATSHVEKFGNAFGESIRKNLEGLNRLNEKLHRSRERIFGLKEAFEATAIGAATFYGIDKLIEGGRNEMRTRMRVRREFGAEAEFISEAGERAGRRAGLENADATKMLIPLAETLRDTVQEGARFRGIKGPLTAAQAAELRRKNLEVGSSLMQRMAILNPELGAGEIGQVMNDALTGPEGIRTMISAFGLSKRSRILSEANEKGQAFKALSPEERKQLGITKQGQFIQQADLVKLMLERSGFTAGAANDEMKTLDFQLKSIGNSFKNVFGEVGEAMMSKLDGGLSKGGTLAERLNQYLDKNKETIRHVGESLGAAAQHVGELAGYLPRIGRFFSEHKTLLLSLGGGFLAFKGLAGIGGMLEKAGKVPGLGGLAGGGKMGIPVYVTNLGAGGGLGGGGLPEKPGSALGKAIPLISTGLAAEAAVNHMLGKVNIGGGLKWSDVTNQFGVFNKDKAVEAIKSQREALIEKFKQENAQKQASVNTQTPTIATAPTVVQLHLDGKKVADVVIPHITRHVRDHTADGAAPTWR